MKAAIHPTYHSEALVTCSCGNTFKTGSTKAEIRVDICMKCHPLWSGEQRYVDTLGQVGKFEQKQKIAADLKKQLKKNEDKANKQEKPKSLKELLMNA